ncbi:hypothetical protein D5018_18190 [Parashewanella curva]|uniref:Uncharacterized protein n=1 Tax=Parashewanella curva TaxID=2338552 RepID=A0A3L8PSC4_9GAMM|nr:hypothetical protein [Parashewanella curva]RLV58266.1 hypothetical protein D5018_18190 [Parashewanella curva]
MDIRAMAITQVDALVHGSQQLAEHVSQLLQASNQAISIAVINEEKLDYRVWEQALTNARSGSMVIQIQGLVTNVKDEQNYFRASLELKDTEEYIDAILAKKVYVVT